ncbi:MAG: 50S ribosomal protein L21 [Patescibacteria group bacterium]|nr:50S ribosomal protein L21 [Patescibacteria group bacterium]
MLAIIKTGGKQYKVKKGDKIRVEKLNKKEGAEVTFSDVLLTGDNKKINLGQPKVKSSKVKAKVLKNGKAKKIDVIKYKNKIRYRKKIGHRQFFTEVEILSIN